MYRTAKAASAVVLFDAVLLSASPAGAQPDRWYVDGRAAGTNDGLTWENAFADLQDALTEARVIGRCTATQLCEIWVAVGTYRPHSAMVTHSKVKGGWPGTTNLGANVDPLFVDPANDDYRLQAGSPCRNAGHNASLPADVADIGSNGNKTERLPKDLALKPRIEGDSVDMGAFEWHPPTD